MRFAALMLICGLTLNVQAQTPQGVEDENKDVVDLTLDHVKKANSVRPVAGSSRKGDNPVLFLVGNSTMRTGTMGNGDNGQWGWGYFAHEWFDETKITVENHALGGTSSRTFYKNLWPAVLKGIKPGDYVIIELGHNDAGNFWFDKQRARTTIPGIDPDTMLIGYNEHTKMQDTVYSYGEYLRRFVRETRAKGATPILASLTPRNSWENDSTITRKLNNYTKWSREVAKEMGVSWIDLEDESAKRLERFGHWKTEYMFYYIDKIHTSKFGAQNNAYSAALAIKHCLGCGLKDYLKPLDLPREKFVRKPGKPVVFLCGDSTCKNKDREDDGMWGWGAQASIAFDTTQCTVVNAAKAGRSTRTYLNEGRWDKVYNSIEPGDIVLIQFGHNDIGPIDKPKYRGVIASGKDSKETRKVYKLEKDGSYEAVYSFGWYLMKFIGDVREKGGIPILLSLTPRNIWKDGKIERRNDTYGQWYREVVEETKVDFVDVHNISADYLDGVGEAAAQYYYNHDHTHTSMLGAQLNAKSVAQGLRDLGYGRLLIDDKAVGKTMKRTEKMLHRIVKLDNTAKSDNVTTPAEK